MRRHRLLLITVMAMACLLLPAVGFAAPQARYDDHALVRAFPGSEQELEALERLGAIVLDCFPGPGTVDCIVPAGALPALRASGIRHVVRPENVQAMIDAEAQRLQQQGGAAAGFGGCDPSWFADYKPLAQIEARLEALATAHPDLAQLITVGTSIEGRPIKGLRITAPGDDPKPVVLVNGCQHAREWIATMVPMYVAVQLVCGAGSDPQIQALLEAMEFIVVPVVNPDGYFYTWPPGDRLWRKNRRNNGNGTFGVDLNRNWEYGWGGGGSSDNPDSDTYHGTSPFSEPETAALRDFFLGQPDIVATIDFHSYGQLVLSPWGYTFDPPPQSGIFAGLGSDLEAAIESVHGEDYVNGPAAPTLYQASGISIDWAFGALGIYAFTIELRDNGQTGFLLPPDQIVPTCEEAMAGVTALAEWALLGVNFTFPAGLPEYVDAQEPAAIAMNITPTTSGAIAAGSETIYARIGNAGPFQAIDLIPVQGTEYVAPLPPAPCGSTIEFYIEVESELGITYRSPQEAPAAVYQTLVFEVDSLFADDFEANLGWTVQNSPGLTGGAWDFGVPLGGGDRGDPAFDGDGSGSCALTQNVDGDSDVDGGTTTLRSPLLDASHPEARVAYSRWYSNDFGANPGTDIMPIEISGDGGASWTSLEMVNENADVWVRKVWRVADFIAPSAQVRLRFVAGDLGGGSVVEAGVDGVEIFTLGCSQIAGDVNGDGVVNVEDLVAVITGWGPCTACAADLNGDGNVDVQDLVIVITNW